MADGFVWTRDGRLHYLQSGNGAPLILLHSVGCSANEYQDVLEPLGKRWSVYAWDMPGHGDSSPITRHYTIDDFAQAAVNFMDALGIDRATVAGSSIGGTICAALGAHHAARVEKLIVVEAPLRSVTTPSAIIYGDRGPTVGKAQELAQLLGDAPMTVLENCGHFPMNDDPAAFVGAINDFVLQGAAL